MPWCSHEREDLVWERALPKVLSSPLQIQRLGVANSALDGYAVVGPYGLLDLLVPRLVVRRGSLFSETA